MISIIVCMSTNMVIGYNNRLPWNIKEDMKKFKELTTGHTVIMGRKTFESIGKPLPNRRNIVISKNMEPVNDIEVVTNIDDILNMCSVLDDEYFIIGGSSIYEKFIRYTDKMYITLINSYVSGDSYFPEYNDLEFNLKSSYQYDEKYLNKDIITFMELERVENFAHR